MARVFVNKLLTEILRPVLDDQPTPKPVMVTKLPSDVGPYLEGGIVYARKTTGSGIHPKFAENAAIQVDCYASDEVKAEALASVIDDAIYDAWSNQTVYDSGYISRYDSTVTPFELPDPAMPEDVSRYTAEYDLLLRPAS